MTYPTKFKNPEDFLKQNPDHTLTQFNVYSYKINSPNNEPYLRLVRKKSNTNEYWNIIKIFQ